jgi:protein-tyrosine phosphatase
LVHCQLGVSRSATLMIGYCMRQAFRKHDLDCLEDVKSMHDSYTFVRAKSRWVAPNIGLLVSSLHNKEKQGYSGKELI